MTSKHWRLSLVNGTLSSTDAMAHRESQKASSEEMRGVVVDAKEIRTHVPPSSSWYASRRQTHARHIRRRRRRIRCERSRRGSRTRHGWVVGGPGRAQRPAGWIHHHGGTHYPWIPSRQLFLVASAVRVRRSLRRPRKRPAPSRSAVSQYRWTGDWDRR